MANDVTHFTEEFWTKSIQAELRKTLVARAIASFKEQALLTHWDKINAPYANETDFSANDYIRWVETAEQEITSENEYLTVDTSKEIRFYFDNLDKIQNSYDVVANRTSLVAQILKQEIDGKFFEEIDNANMYIDDGSIWGTSWNPITLTVDNVVKTFSTAKATMYNNNVSNYKPLIAVITNDVASIIEQWAVAKWFNIADATYRNGFVWDFMGYKIYISNNLEHKVNLVSSSNYSANETVVINWVTFTFKAAPSVAWEVDLWSNEAASMANLVAAINGWAWAGSDYIELSTADRNKLKNSRVVASTDGVHTISLVGSWKMILSETASSAAFGDQISHMYTWLKGSTSLVIQQDVTVQKNKSEKRTGYSFLAVDLYGMKTFKEGRETLLDMRIKA